MDDSDKHNLSAKEDKKIKCTLLLIADNDKKLVLIEKLSACVDLISDQSIDFSAIHEFLIFPK